LQAEVRQLEKDLAEQTRMVDTLKSGSVGNTTGYSQYMRAFSRQVVQGLWLTSFKVTGDGAVSLNGAAVNRHARTFSAGKASCAARLCHPANRQPKVDASQSALPRYVNSPCIQHG
jgi:hypothetical protein